MMIFAAMSVLLFWVSFATTKERVHPPPIESDVRADLRALLENGPWVALSFVSVFNFANFALRGGATVYYFKYYVGDAGTPIFLIFDKTAAFFFMAPDQYTLMLLVGIVGTGALGAATPLVWSMYADSADYGEWRTGRRTTGLVFSATMFAMKVGTAIGAGLAGYVLALFGFVANEAQSDSSIVGIKLMFSFFPAAMAAFAALSVVFYGIDGATISQIERELAQRR